MAREPRHLHRPLAFLDPLLRRPSLVVEADYRPARRSVCNRRETPRPCGEPLSSATDFAPQTPEAGAELAENVNQLILFDI